MKKKIQVKKTKIQPRTIDPDIPFFRDVLSKAILDRDFCFKLIQTNIRKDHYPKPWMQWAYATLKTYIDDPKYGAKLPSLNIFKDKLERDKTVEREAKIGYYEHIQNLFKRSVKNEEYSLEVISKKVRRREFKIHLKEAVLNIDKFEDPDVAINKFTSRTFKLAKKNNNYTIIDLLEDPSKRNKERLFKIKNPQLFKRFKFNIEGLDACLPIGMYAGMFGTIAGKTGRGKSIIADWVGFQGLIQDFGVTHFISENSLEQCTARYDSLVTGFKYDNIQLADLSVEDLKKYNKTYKDLKEKVKGKLKIVKLAPNEFNAATIMQIITMLEGEGHKTELCVIDSPDLMQSVVGHKEKRFQASAVYWELTTIFDEKKIIGFGTTQLTKASEDENPTSEDLSEAYDKSRLLHLVLVLTQTKTQKANNEASLWIVKNRDGKTPFDPIYLGTEFHKMSFFEKKNPLTDREENGEVKSKLNKPKPTLKVIDGGNKKEKLVPTLKKKVLKKIKDDAKVIKIVKKEDK